MMENVLQGDLEVSVFISVSVVVLPLARFDQERIISSNDLTVEVKIILVIGPTQEVVRYLNTEMWSLCGTNEHSKKRSVKLSNKRVCSED